MRHSPRRPRTGRAAGPAVMLISGLAALTACAGSGSTAATTPGPATSGDPATTAATTPAVTSGYGAGAEVARAELAAPDGTSVGSVTFSTSADSPSSLVVRVSAEGLQPGFKGLHVHTVGKCEPNSPDPTDPANVGNFLSAGGHLKAQGENHAGHDGDLSSLMVRSDGSAELVVGTDSLPLDALLDADGSAVIVHLGPDNFGNIPTRYAPAPDAATLNTGDSGGRAACGVVEVG